MASCETQTLPLPVEDRKPRVLIAGIAGASLGTEIAKSLRHGGGYDVLGCDISPLAFGHYDNAFDRTFLIDRESYIDGLLALCDREAIDCLIPGGDQPAVLIGRNVNRFADSGIRVAQNDPQIVAQLSDKNECFKWLAKIGSPIPRTRLIATPEDLDDLPMPCVVKPATESGGSAFVFFAADRKEAAIYCHYLKANSRVPIAQEYVSIEHGEFTVGVLCHSDGAVAGAVALKRSFDSKLSVLMRGSGFLISSGYSQGKIEAYPDICRAAVDIAKAVGSRGPLNIQGRLNSDGVFVPFEINPRFSASTFLRTLAGFNEVDHFVRAALGLPQRSELVVKPGWYLRTLAERAISIDQVTK